MARGEKSDPKFHAPFRDLDKLLRRPRRERAAQPAPPAAKNPAPRSLPARDEDELFRQAMAGVRPVARDRARRPSPRRGSAPAPPDEDREAYAQLAALVDGGVAFDVADTDEYVEGCVADFDRRELRRLRRGEFSIQSHLDLHGMTRPEARAALERFIVGAVASGHRCVLIVPGRGQHSRDQVPVLKEKLRAWLCRGRIGRAVLAFTSARPVDGGTGAVYVLLRRSPRP